MKAALIVSVVCFFAGARANCDGGIAYSAGYGTEALAPVGATFLGAPIASSCSSGNFSPLRISAAAPSIAYSDAYTNVAPAVISAPAISAAVAVPAPIRYDASPIESVSAVRIVAPGVSECGPAPSPTPILPLRPIVLPASNSPIYNLPSAPLPRPVVIANKCSCTKTVLKPQLYQRVIRVQKNQRFLKRTYKPVTQSISYNARPRC